MKKLTAFLELESAIRACGELPRQAGEMFAKLGVAKPILNQAEDFPPLGTARTRNRKRQSHS
jgi:hypothetical protein